MLKWTERQISVCGRCMTALPPDLQCCLCFICPSPCTKAGFILKGRNATLAGKVHQRKGRKEKWERRKEQRRQERLERKTGQSSKGNAGLKTKYWFVN